MKLGVVDRESVFIGTVEARVGLVTREGAISRMTDKTIWCVGKSGVERMFRSTDGRMPSVARRSAGKAFESKN